MKLYLYRLSLTEPTYSSLFDVPFEGDRKGFLKDIFSSAFQFLGWGGVVLQYIHLATEGDAIFGSISRWRSEVGQANPKEPFAESEQGGWYHSTFLINLENDEQVVAVADVQKVGKPQVQIEYLVRHLNKKYSGYPFKIDYFNVSREESFKRAVDAYPGKVTFIRFDVVPPNPINGEAATKKALKKLREHTNADKVTGVLQSDEGLKVDSSRILGLAEYANSGAGDIIAKSGDELVYDSRLRGVVINGEDSLVPVKDPPSG